MKIATMIALALALFSIGCSVHVPPTVPMSPEGARVTVDAEAGYRNYARPLATLGAWEPDARYGAHWCPNGVGRDFVPFASRGHWTISNRKMGSAPAGVPTWQSHDPAWGDITYQHGFWARTDTTRPSPWCWIPGAEETPARVVWREGGGFVGWAPEEPDTRVDDDVDFENLEWVYELVSSLLDPNLDGGKLRGAEREMAEYATWRRPIHRVAHVGPSREQIARAVRAFEGYRSAHPEVATPEGDSSEHGSSVGAAPSSTKGSSSASISTGSSSAGHAAKLSIGGASSSSSIKIVEVGGIKIAIVTDVSAMPPMGLPLDLPPPEYMMAVDPARVALVDRPMDPRLPGSPVGDRYVASRVGGGSDDSGASHARGIAARRGGHGAAAHTHSSGHSSSGSSHGKGWSFGHGAFRFHR